MATERPQPIWHLLAFCAVVSYAALLATTYVMGIWLVDKQGHAVATDFIAFWAAGKLVLQGNAAGAYDWVAHKAMAEQAAGTTFSGAFTWQYPPTLLLATPLLALIPYPAALVGWMTVSASAFGAAVRLAARSRAAVLAAFAWPAVFWNVVVGQTGFLTAALMTAALALLDRRPALAGVAFGLMTYKPQFGLLIPVALIAGARWRVIGFAALTATALGAAATLAFGPGIWSAFLGSAARVNAAILEDGGVGFEELQSLYGFARTIGLGSMPALALHLAAALVMAGGIAWLWRQPAADDLKAAALAVTSILASPYVFAYDLVVLVVPLVFLGRQGFSRIELTLVILAGLLVAYGPSETVPTGLLAGGIILALVCGRVLASRRAPSETVLVGVEGQAAA